MSSGALSPPFVLSWYEHRCTMAALPFSFIAFAIAVLSLSRIVTCAPAPPLRPRSGPLPSYVTEFGVLSRIHGSIFIKTDKV